MYPYRLDIHLQTLTCHIHFYHHFFLTSFRLLSDFTAKFISFLFYDPFFSYCFFLLFSLCILSPFAALLLSHITLFYLKIIYVTETSCHYAVAMAM